MGSWSWILTISSVVERDLCSPPARTTVPGVRKFGHFFIFIVIKKLSNNKLNVSLNFAIEKI